MWSYHARTRIERLQVWLVWRLPRWLIYWATIRLWAHATTGRWSHETPVGMEVNEVLKRWSKVPDNRQVMRDRYPYRQEQPDVR